MNAGAFRVRTAALTTCLGLTAWLVCGCSIQPDSAPRDIPADLQEQDTPSATGAGGAARGSDRIYLLAPEGAEQPLRTVQRDTDSDAQALLTELISGPNPGELEAGYRTAIPSTLGLRSVRVEDGVVQVDLSDALLDLSGGELTLAVAQIVFTSSEIPGAESVLIRVDGSTQEWPDGSGAQHRGPLTTYDFIGYAESAQPAYPVSPAPTTAVPPSTTAPATTVAPSTTSTPTTTGPATTTTAPAPPAATTTTAA